jgi:small subunit ribosomal protein S19
MSRAKWKGPFLDWQTLISSKKIFFPNLWSRSSMVPKKFTDTIVCVHNGQEFKRVVLTRHKIGYKLGEFSFTRKLKSKRLPKSSKLKKVQAKKAPIKKAPIKKK